MCAAICAITFTGISLLLRLPTLSFAGTRTQVAFNEFAFAHIWAYSDVASLYFRDRLWLHPAPYFDYRLEYPVVTGAFIWLAGIAHRTVGAYMAITTMLLAGCAGACAVALRRLPRANPWLLAASPTLVVYAVMNWDLLALALMLGALVAFLADRLVLAGAVLALAVWAKGFPVAFLAVMLLLLLRSRRIRAAGLLTASFGLGSIAVNLPVALYFDSGLHVRHNWTYFFEFQRTRHPGLSIWSLSPFRLSVSDINTIGAMLGIAGCTASLVAVYRWAREDVRGLVLAPAGLALLAWIFAVSKVNSPQYTLWIVALLAASGAPTAFVVALSVFDVGYYMSDFTSLFLSGHAPSAHGPFQDRVVHPAVAVREAFLLAAFAWGLWTVRVRGRLATGRVRPLPAPPRGR